MSGPVKLTWKDLFTGIPGGIWCIGCVTLLKNISSVIVVTYSPVFLREVLKTSISHLAFLEGAIEGMSYLARIFSGVISDSMGKRKPLIVFGYGLSLLGRVFIAHSSSGLEVFLSRSSERLGNGIQASPRDAYVADLSSKHNSGKCYGLRQSLSFLGSVLGALIGMAFMWYTCNDFHHLFLFAIIPSALAIVLLVVGIKEPKPPVHTKDKVKFSWNALKRDISGIPLACWKIILLSFFFMIGNFSISLIGQRAQQLGCAIPHLPLIMVAQNVGSLLSALPAGWLADRLGRRKVLVIGFCVLALSNGILTFTSSVWVIFVSTFLLGAQIGISHSNLMAYLAETTPPHLRGTTFGVYHFVSGSAIFLGTSAVGCFWEAFSHAHGFGFSVVMVGLSIILAPLLLPKSLRSHSCVTQSKA